jgi:hypothetical protein
MSILILTQVYDEVRRVSIAGSVVAPGDFRLKKLVAPLEQSGLKAPVFTKVAQAVKQVVDSNDRTSAESLLELSTLVNAILYTQGETGLDGTLEPIKGINLGLQATQTSASVLKPLLDALTNTGSGRIEIIKDAHQRGAFADLRLIQAALSALDDSYPEIANFMCEDVLPLYGMSILPELRARYDQKGRGGHARRLSLMHRLDPQGTRELVKQALDEGSKEVKIVAIECLGESPEDLVFLLEQARSKAKDVRTAALKVLARSNNRDAVAALRSAFVGAEMDTVVEPIRNSRVPEVLQFVLEETSRFYEELLSGKEKDKKVIGKQVHRFFSQLECLSGRDDSDTEKFLLECFAKRAKLVTIKSDMYGGKDLLWRIVLAINCGSKRSKEVLAESHSTLDERELGEAFVAACEIWPAKKVYTTFSSYLVIKSGEKVKKNNPVAAKQASITAVMCGQWHWNENYFEEARVAQLQGLAQSKEELAKIDPRWLDLALELEDLELVKALARPGHAGANRKLINTFDEMLKKGTVSDEIANLLETIVRVQHPAATDSLIAVISKRAKSAGDDALYRFGRLIPRLPKESLPKFEALLPTLPEKAIDQLHDFVTQLKNKT